MKKNIVFFTLVSFLLTTSVSNAVIESINATDLVTSFSPTSGELALVDTVEIVVQYTGGVQTAISGSFSMSTLLQTDLSSGGIASAHFESGSISFVDGLGDPLLTGTVNYIDVKELFDGGGVLAGKGRFAVTGGSLTGDFVLSEGEIFELTFHVGDIGDFSSYLSGRSDVTVTPIPEPASLMLLGLGGLAALLRKRTILRHNPGV